ncbi:MAG: dihydrolipoyl dehydrogenase [bacterium]
MYDLVIIGAGPGGYVSAIKAAQLGCRVVLIEKAELGGTCLNKGCIPTKTLLSAADKISELKKLSKYGIKATFEGVEVEKLLKRKDITILKLEKGIEKLLNSYNIEVIKGEAAINNQKNLEVNDQKINFKNLIIATGSTPSDLPNIKRDGEFIVNSDDILKLKELPKSLLIIGSGAIGIEWARIFSALGTQTTIIEIAKKLSPTSDLSISEYLEKEFKQNKIKAFIDTKIEKIEEKKVYLNSGEILEPVMILLAAGRKPDLGIVKNLDLQIENGFIEVDENFKTSIDNIYAIGDINGIMQLAHVASHQGVCAVENILQKKEATIDYNSIPFIIYGKPEIASVGKKEEEGYQVSTFPIGILGKAVADDEQDGFVKIIAKDGLIKGAHIISKEASSLIHVLALAMKEKISINSLEEFVFAHPTYAEGIHEAILGLKGEALHLPKESK